MRARSLINLGLFSLLLSSLAHAQTVKIGPSTNTNPEVGGKTLDEWIKLAGDRDASVREHAIRMIGSLGHSAQKAVPTLIKQLAVPNDLSPLTCAAIAIGQIVPEDKDAKDSAAALVNLLNHDQHIIRYQAATALGHIGSPARSTRAIEKLSRMIKEPMSWELRRAAAYALGRLGRDDALNLPDMKALTALVDGIDDQCKEVRVESLQGLINLGLPPDPKDLATLKELLIRRTKVDRDKFASIWIRVALIRMDMGKDTTPHLINYIANQLKSTEAGIPADAARALGACGQLSKAKVPELIECLKSSDVTLTVWAAWALGRIGPDAKAALPALTTLLESADPMVKSSAQEAIKDIGGSKP